MRFITRSLLGIFILSLTLGLLVLAGGTLWRAIEAKSNEDPRRRTAQERVFAVNVETLVVGEATPVITAFGEVASWRNLQLRAVTSGRILELSENVRDGGSVAAGDVLAQLDPANAQTALDLARTQTAEAKAELTEAEAALLLAKDEVAASQQQRDLRAKALERQRDLLDRGAGTSTAVETAELSLSSAEQTFVGRRQALAQADARINRAKIALDRQQISLAEAERALAETTIRAPFDGLLSEVSAVPGGLVSANEILGTLIDPQALEIAFRVSNAQYARLIGENGALRDVTIRATLPLDDFPITVTGQVDRAGARVGDGQTGRLLYARVESGGAALRPGDFMVVEIDEPALTNVSVIPATAANSTGEILLIDEGDRLEAATVAILRRQGDELIVSGAEVGREYATERLPQLGTGVKVRPVRPGDGLQEQQMVQLDAARRSALMAAVEANARMPKAVKERMLSRLQQDEVPMDIVARLEGGGRPAEPPEAGDTVALDDDRRAKLIAFVEANNRMPSEAKARILAQLNEEMVPRKTIERLESRMGG